jgi:AraC-like DNA-binding protein
MAARVIRFTPADGLHKTPIDAVTLARSTRPSVPVPSVYEPSLCVVVQGRKRAVLGDDAFVYDALNYLVASVTLPARSHIIEATPDKPYLCLLIRIDIGLINELLLRLGPTAVPKSSSGRALFLGQMTDSMLDALWRLTSLLDTGESEASVVAPLVLEEIHYRALTGQLGHRLRDLCAPDSHAQRIARVIRLLKSEFAAPLRVETLAAAAHMSVSSLHHRFKEVTAMSPMQYQKQLRLHEARRLMLVERLDAAAAGYRVGYESPSQFGREYRRLFGASPRREVRTLQTTINGPTIAFAMSQPFLSSKLSRTGNFSNGLTSSAALQPERLGHKGSVANRDCRSIETSNRPPSPALESDASATFCQTASDGSGVLSTNVRTPGYPYATRRPTR